MTSEDYIQTIQSWRAEMDANLRRENGWLALAGLFWRQEGTNSVGSDPNCDIQLPERAPKKLGRFEFDGRNVALHIETGGAVEVNGVETQTVTLETDQEDLPSFITLDEMRMVVIRRAQGVGIRLWDNSLTARRDFPSREWYPVKVEFRLPATYSRYAKPKIVQMPDIFGGMQDEKMDGYLAFRRGGRSLKLLVAELEHQPLGIPCKDLTNAKTP